MEISKENAIEAFCFAQQRLDGKKSVEDSPKNVKVSSKDSCTVNSQISRQKINLKGLPYFLKYLNIKYDQNRLVYIQSCMRLLAKEKDLSQGVTFALLWRWLKQEYKPGQFEQNNILLIREELSNVRLPTRNLREKDFVYGSKNIPDKEGAGKVITKWVAGTRSQSKAGGISLHKVNKAAIKQKLVTPKEYVKFFRENRNAKELQKRIIQGRKKGGKRFANSEKVFGKPSPPQEFTSFSEVIFPYKDGQEERNYLDLSGQRLKGKLPFPQPTKSSMLQADIQKSKKTCSGEEVHPWKMPRFQKVAAKVEIPKFHLKETIAE